MSELAEFISRMDYDNPAEFMAYITRKVLKKSGAQKSNG